MTDRRIASDAFLSACGWGKATRQFLAGDASDRSYDRVTMGGTSAVLMDAPPGTGDDPAAFIAMAQHLAGLGLSPPRILHHDLTQGFLLIEDLGDNLFARLVARDAAMEQPLYAEATDVLVTLQAQAAPAGLANLSAAEWAQAAAFALDWYAFGITGQRPQAETFVGHLTDAMKLHADGPRVLILRDFHAENLLLLPDRTGVARVGLLDFQLGQNGQPGYDLVSLLQDARRDVSPSVEAEMMARFVARTGWQADQFAAHYAVLGAQRALRILGVFARLCMVAGKTHYLLLLPRVWQQLQRNLTHPALSSLHGVCDVLLPPPTPDALERIRAQCGKHSR